MRLYGADCQADEIGVPDCACEWCTRLRVLQVEEFVAADKLRRSMWPAVQYDDSGDIVITSRDETVRMEVRCG
jgi:hypothetical protein